MAEAKARRISHFKSEIFNEGPPPTQKRFHSANPKKQESSQIFTPHQHVPKPLSQSRERSYKNSDIFQATKEQAALALDVSKHTDNTSMKVAGKKEKVYKMDWATRNDSHYYRRSVDKNIKILDFQPKYAEQTVQERKEKEFFGGFHPIHKIKEPRAENSEKTARELKKLQMRSIFDKPINNENIPPQSLNTQKDYKPSQRKFEILASAVFEDKPINEYPNSYKKEVYDEKRHKNHLYSDLLDTSYEFPQKSKKSDLQSSSQTWLLHSTKVNNIS